MHVERMVCCRCGCCGEQVVKAVATYMVVLVVLVVVMVVAVVQDEKAVAVVLVVVVMACKMNKRFWWLSLWLLWHAGRKSS